MNAKIYFPYAWSGLSQADFIAKKIIEKNIPGISTNRPDIVKLLIDFQWFTSSNNEWLPIFMELNNQNKHQSLTPQIKKEYKQLNIQSGNVSISLGQGASIKLGQGASISFGGVNIKGGQEIDVNNPAKFSGNGTQEIVTWVSFNFQHNEVPVLPFLETSFIGASQIVKKLSVV